MGNKHEGMPCIYFLQRTRPVLRRIKKYTQSGGHCLQSADLPHWVSHRKSFGNMTFISNFGSIRPVSKLIASTVADDAVNGSMKNVETQGIPGNQVPRDSLTENRVQDKQTGFSLRNA